jgi:putative ABC transport system permease protein
MEGIRRGDQPYRRRRDGVRFQNSDFRRAIERRIGRLRLAPARHAEIVDELSQHLQDRFDELRAAGMSEQAAAREALAELTRLGRQLAAIEKPMSQEPPVFGFGGRPMIGALAHDVRYAARTFARNPGFTAVVLLTLALGIGATTAIFTVMDAVMLRPYPYPDIDRIMILRETMRTGQLLSVAWPNFQDWRDQNQVFESIGLYRPTVMNLTGGDRPERVVASLMSSDAFKALGIEPAVGRGFSRDEDTPAASRVAVVSQRFWRARFSDKPAAVGGAIVLDGETYTIVGVMPPGMRFPSRLTDVWVPLGLFVGTFPSERGAHPGLTVVAKLKPAVTVARAAADMDAIARRLEQQYPMSNTDHSVAVQPYYEQIVENIRPALLTLMVAVVFVLLIACANLANLMFARSDARQREIAIRVALGAGRGRVFQQLLTETVLLALGGGVLGTLVAWWGVRAFVATGPTIVPRIDLVQVDLRVLAFALAVSIATGIAFGLLPALRAASLDLLDSLKEAARGSRGAGLRTRAALVVAEVALALVLLIGAGLAIRSFARLTSVDLGFDPSRVVTMHASLPDSQYRDVARWTRFHRDLVQHVAAIPGLEGVALNSAVPLAGMGSESEVRYEGQLAPSSPKEEGTASLFQAVTPDYFRVMGVPILRGRSFTDRDTANSVKVVIVEESLARKFFRNTDPVGKRIAFEFTGHGATAQPIWREVVGVVGHVRHYGLVKEPTNYEVYAPLDQLPIWFQNRRPTMTLFARTALEPEQVIAAVRQTVSTIDRDIPVFGLQTMEQYVGQATEQSRVSTTVLTLFGALGLVLSSVGIYGVLSFLVGRRTREIGIRLALGATRRDVLRLIVGHGMTLAAVGIAAGLGAAWALTRLLANLLYGISPHDPATFVGLAGLLGAVALFASALPALRATRVSPVEALRQE